MLDMIDPFYQILSSEMKICKVDGKIIEYHCKLKQLSKFLAFFDTEVFSLLDKKKLIFCSSLQSCFWTSSHILTEVNFSNE